MQENENKTNPVFSENSNNTVADFDNAKKQEGVEEKPNPVQKQVLPKETNLDSKTDCETLSNNQKDLKEETEQKNANLPVDTINFNEISENEDKNFLESIEINSNVVSNEKEKTTVVKTIEIITGSTVFRYALGAMIIFAICFISSLFTFNIVLVPIEVQGYSMLPTINASASGDGGETYTDIVYVSKSKNIRKKDIVVIKGGKTPSGKQIIKRVIATPGDTLTFKKVDTTYEYGQIYFVVDIYLNGNKLEETYTKEKQTKIQNTYESSEYYAFYNNLVSALKNNNTTETITAGEFSVTMGKNEYFVMGDNRNSYNIADERAHGSIDSRMFGTVKQDEIVGKVAIQVKYGKNMLESIWQSIFGTRLQIA